MPTIEDELRRVMDGYSAGDRLSVDRRAAVERRVVRHRRQRVALAAGAVALVLAVAGGAWAMAARHRAAPYPPATTPGSLPAYYAGGKLVASAGGTVAADQPVSFTFTPTTWNFTIGNRCDASQTQWLSIKVNGNAFVGTQCAPDGGPGDNAPEFDQFEQYWSAMGVRLGQPTTVTATFTPDGHESPAAYGTIAIGAYVQVPYERYPIPPRPSDAATGLGGSQGELDNPLLTIVGGTATTETRPFTMPDRILVDVDMVVPGMISVYVDDVQVAECDSWDWHGYGCSGGVQIVGTDRLSRFTTGQAVTITVVTRHVTGTGTWRVVLNGR